MRRYHLYLFLSLLFSLLLILWIPIISRIKPFLPFTDYLLGTKRTTSYLILLGNDTEIRANGGFVGSYAKINLNFPKIDLDFQDIYVPNGQVSDYVTPPLPIQQAFGHGTWQLANADWEPDFGTASKSIRWFLEKGQEKNPDILSIINLSTIKDILTLVGPFSVPEFDSTITPDNLYLFLQGKAEVGFFPGSTQKKDALYSVGHAFFKKAQSLSFRKKIQLVELIYNELIHKNIILNSLNPDFQNLLVQKDFAGVFSSSTEDTYSLIETNLGANKANGFLTRQTYHRVIARNLDQRSDDAAIQSGKPHSISHQIVINFQNNSPEANPNPPFHYGGNYIAYLRLYIPRSAQNIKLNGSVIPAEAGIHPITPTTPPSLCAKSLADPTACVQDPTITQKYNLTEIGFFQITPAGGASTIDLSYDLTLSLPRYSLTILKQHGMKSSPQDLSVNNQNIKTDLNSDFFFTQK